MSTTGGNGAASSRAVETVHLMRNEESWSLLDSVRTLVGHGTRRLACLRNEPRLKQVDASTNVLHSYHDSFLYGKIPLAVRIRTAFRAGLVGYAWYLVEFILAVMSGTLYVYSTYHPDLSVKWVLTVQHIASVAFVADYVLRVYSEPVRTAYIFSTKGIIDLLSGLPLIFLFKQQIMLNNGGSIIRLLQFLRIVRIFSLIAKLGLAGSTITEQIILLTVSTFGVIFLDAGLLQWAEYTGRKKECPAAGCMTFWDAFYFLIVTIATVGYGDITPHTQIGQFISVLTILVALVILPIQVGRITSIASRRPYGGAFSSWKVVDSSFLIISGSLCFTVIEEFLAEIFNSTHAEDLEAYPLRVVILAPFSPSFDLKQLLSIYHGQVEFIEGSPVASSDLERVSADKASAFFLLADQEAQNSNVEDAAQIVRALSVHRFCRGKVRIILEVLEAETQASAVWDETQSGGIEVICPSKIHYKMIARSCFVKGLYTFITNAFTSELKLESFGSDHFMSEYFHSFDNEFYPLILPSCFHNLLFEEVAEFVFSCFNVTLFALDIPTSDEATGAPTRRVLLHPKGHLVQSDDVGLCISWDLHTAYLISQFDDKDYQKMSVKRSVENQFISITGKQMKILDSASQKWRARGPMARGNWLETNVVQSSGRFSGLMPTSPDGRKALKAEMRTAINRVFEGGNVEKGVSSPGSVSDRSRLGDLEEWDQAFSRGEMNDMDGRFPEGENLTRATEELLAWPPLPQFGRPSPAVIARQKEAIMKNLDERILSIVSFQKPHILVCCQRSWPEGIYYFLAELRKPGFPNPPVVILHPLRPTPRQWGSAGVFADVFFLQGSPVYELDLIRGGVLNAGKVVVLANQGSSDLKGREEADHKSRRKRPAAYTSDVDNIIVVANVERLIKDKVDIVAVEMQHTLGFYYLRPQLEIPRSMVPTQDFRRNRDALVHFAPPYMAGKAFSCSMMGFLLRASFYNKHTVSIVEQLVSGGFVEDADGVSSERHRILEQIPVPAEFSQRRYSDLFLALLSDNGVLALGLYRPAGTFGSPTAYVFTNPPKDTIVNAADLVYVLV